MTKRAAARAELLRNARRTNLEIARLVGCGRHTVAEARAALIREGRIVKGKGYTLRIRALWPGWTGSKTALARHIGCHVSQVKMVVDQMEAEAHLARELERMRNG